MCAPCIQSAKGPPKTVLLACIDVRNQLQFDATVTNEHPRRIRGLVIYYLFLKFRKKALHRSVHAQPAGWLMFLKSLPGCHRTLKAVYCPPQADLSTQVDC
jgi:hypothetical protein